MHIKVHMFWEGQKILRNLHQLFVLCTASQIIGGDFAKFCGLLRIYDLYDEEADGNDSWCGFIQVKVLILLLSYRPKRPLFPRYAFSPIGLEGRHCVQSIRHFELVPTKDQQRAFEWLFHLLQTGKEFYTTFYLVLPL